MEIIKCEEQKEKRLKKNEQNLGDLSDTNRPTNTHSGRYREKRQKRAERTPAKTMAENFSNLLKAVNMNKKLSAVQVRLTQRDLQQELKNSGPRRQVADIFKVLKEKLSTTYLIACKTVLQK